ncbi:DNA repair protein RecO [Patescibacteria group bacterium]
MRTKKTPGIVIRKNAVNEKNCAVLILSPFFGKIDAYAKGARNIKSKFTGHLDLLNVCDFEIYDGPGSNIVTECSLKKNFPNFSKDLKKFFFSSLIAKILIKFTNENENSEDIYNLCIGTFNALEKYPKEDVIFESFKIKFCDLLGSLPDLEDLKNTEFQHFDESLKQTLNTLYSATYENIQNVRLNKQQKEQLKQTTDNFLALAS